MSDTRSTPATPRSPVYRPASPSCSFATDREMGKQLTRPTKEYEIVSEHLEDTNFGKLLGDAEAAKARREDVRPQPMGENGKIIEGGGKAI